MKHFSQEEKEKQRTESQESRVERDFCLHNLENREEKENWFKNLANREKKDFLSKNLENREEKEKWKYNSPARERKFSFSSQFMRFLKTILFLFSIFKIFRKKVGRGGGGLSKHLKGADNANRAIQSNVAKQVALSVICN